MYNSCNGDLLTN